MLRIAITTSFSTSVKPGRRAPGLSSPSGRGVGGEGSRIKMRVIAAMVGNLVQHDENAIRECRKSEMAKPGEIFQRNGGFFRLFRETLAALSSSNQTEKWESLGGEPCVYFSAAHFSVSIAPSMSFLGDRLFLHIDDEFVHAFAFHGAAQWRIFIVEDA